ncbi:MAG: hypothetical protein DM484_27830 [Candidatus Methylumidiphilus alinenensis]|uniref:Uncharacterized protein n=1 Tax=Candidatus Methylumidiphilus alinenensis TaxID=2202197 RepID=A0A2W4QHU8_9GAMM|nr:MAG: hypothetical protein DM484_27830 [Candidatus Methylumidiphilus alinenensis]
MWSAATRRRFPNTIFVPPRARWHEAWLDEEGKEVPPLKHLKHDIDSMLNKAIAAIAVVAEAEKGPPRVAGDCRRGCPVRQRAAYRASEIIGLQPYHRCQAGRERLPVRATGRRQESRHDPGNRGHGRAGRVARIPLCQRPWPQCDLPRPACQHGGILGGQRQ